MKENFYEILEISEKASPEVIKKVYNVFVKKYHPDLWSEDKKAWAEEKMKKINQAYETLSNEEKRKEYDEELEASRNNNDSYKTSASNAAQYSTSEYRQPEYQNTVNNENITYNEDDYSQEEFTQEMQQKIEEELRQKAEREYNEAYENYLRSLGYKIKYKKTFREYLNGVLSILIIIVISFIIWKIPFTNRYLRNIYEENELIKAIVDTILKILGKS